MSRCQCHLALLFVVLLAALFEPTSAVAQRTLQRRPEIVTVSPGVYTFMNPCALDGSGEEVMLSKGSIELSYDRQQRLTSVLYRGVIGVGTVSGSEYAVAYQESHRYMGRRERFASRMVVTGDSTVFRDEYAGMVGSLKRKFSCS